MKRNHKKIIGIVALAFIVAAIAAMVWLTPRWEGQVWHVPVLVAVMPPPVVPPSEQQPTPTPEQNQQPAANISPVLPKPEEIPPHFEGKPRIAIIIDDMGLDPIGSARAIILSPSVTLSFLPYANDLSDQTERARLAGHELLLHMPMEPIGHENPGPGTLRVGMPPEELRAILEKALASFSGFDGVNNHMGSKFTADSEGMSLVVDVLREHHLFFLDSRTGMKSVGEATAKAHNLPAGARDVFLDNDTNPAAIRGQLAEVEREARRKGSAIAIGHPHAETLQVLEDWLPGAPDRGFELVPVRELIH
jgi:hypothetical protein